MYMGLSHKYCHVSGLNCLIIRSSQSILFNSEQRLHKFICRPTVILQNSYNCRLSRPQRSFVDPSSVSSYIAILHTARSLFTKPSAFRLRCKLTAAKCERCTIQTALSSSYHESLVVEQTHSYVPTVRARQSNFY